MNLLYPCEWAGPVPYPDELAVEPKGRRVRCDGPLVLPFKGVVYC